MRITESQLRRIIREELLLIERFEMVSPIGLIKTAAEKVQYTSDMTIENFFNEIENKLPADYKDLFKRIRQTKSDPTNIELNRMFNAKQKRAGISAYATTLPSGQR